MRSAAAQAAGDVLGANAVLMDAYETDVRPLLGRGARADWASTPTRWPRTPVRLPERIVAERVGGKQAGWGA